VSVQEVASTVQGKVTVPGELRTITNEEVSRPEPVGRKTIDHFVSQIQLAQGVGAKKK
jgi:hypothetical protein